MFAVLENEQLSLGIVRLVVDAPRIAEVRRPGQFVIVRLGAGAERIPLTIADADADAGTIALVIQAVGKSTRDLVALQPGQAVRDVVGPLGRPTTLLDRGHAVCVGGGVGTAVVYPIARAMAESGVKVSTVLGARSHAQVILEARLREVCDVHVCTDDGSYGRAGQVTDVLADLLAAGPVDTVYAVGPVRMMQACARLTRPLGVPTVVSLNSIMVDGTGMCGGCRVSVAGQTRYACVDGPEFDGHLVDYDMLADRLTTYQEFEGQATCRAPVTA